MTIRFEALRPTHAAAPPLPHVSAPPSPPVAPPSDGIRPRPPADVLAALRHGRLRHDGGPGVALRTTPERAAAIARGEHQVRIVDGRALRYPSQRLGCIESRHPDDPGQTHAIERHVGTTLAENVARLAATPLIRAAGSYTTLASAQRAVDETIANPANQDAIGAFLADAGRTKTVLARVDLGGAVGTTTLRADVLAGEPRLVSSATATVVLIKDPTFPEGYRVLTTYPDTRPPEVDARGTPLA